MQLPFTTEQFLDVFSAYNTSVWPAQMLLTVFGLAATVLTLQSRFEAGAIISTLLALLWAWMGLIYHLTFFTQINALAYGFGILSLVASGLFLWHGVFMRRLQFRATKTPRSLLGLGFIIFALAIYPLWTSLSGHRYPAFPTFGLPCPTTIFTIGLLALAVGPYPRAPLMIPVLWCFIGGQAALLLEIQADLGLWAAGVLGIALIGGAGGSRARDRA